MTQTPQELFAELKLTNDKYHIAFDKIMQSNEIDVSVKAKSGAFANNIFQLMTELENHLKNYLENETQDMPVTVVEEIV